MSVPGLSGLLSQNTQIFWSLNQTYDSFLLLPTWLSELMGQQRRLQFSGFLPENPVSHGVNFYQKLNVYLRSLDRLKLSIFSELIYEFPFVNSNTVSCFYLTMVLVFIWKDKWAKREILGKGFAFPDVQKSDKIIRNVKARYWGKRGQITETE